MDHGLHNVNHHAYIPALHMHSLSEIRQSHPGRGRVLQSERRAHPCQWFLVLAAYAAGTEQTHQQYNKHYMGHCVSQNNWDNVQEDYKIYSKGSPCAPVSTQLAATAVKYLHTHNSIHITDSPNRMLKASMHCTWINIVDSTCKQCTWIYSLVLRPLWGSSWRGVWGWD